MKREFRYPDTETFHYYNANPHNRKGGDCVVRAICTALGQDWGDTLMELTKLGLVLGYMPTDPQCYTKYLNLKGWKKWAQPRKALNTKYTGKEFCTGIRRGEIGENPLSHENIIAHIGGNHIVAIIDNRIRDIWDSSKGCIGNFWTKKE